MQLHYPIRKKNVLIKHDIYSDVFNSLSHTSLFLGRKFQELRPYSTKYGNLNFWNGLGGMVIFYGTAIRYLRVFLGLGIVAEWIARIRKVFNRRLFRIKDCLQ